MPRYFIDLHDGAHLVRDREGFDLPDIETARERAVRMMMRVARELTDAPDRQDYVAAVRDADGIVRLRLRLSLDPDPAE